MNIHQEHLLELLKEVDAFCKEHQITYYCAGGTVIGAARHRGFIPWDDDIDIYMTRDEFGRFAEALEKYGPKDRKLEYYEADHDRRAPVPRYHRDTDTMFCHFHLLGRSCAGTSLDVFILDPIPDDHEARLDYISKLYAYCDLVAPCHVYSHRLPTSRFDVYDKYKKIADEQGVPHAVEMVSDEIFHFKTSECSCYCLRWGSIILIYPIEVIGKPVYLPFEDMMIPVPQDWYRYLVIHYGMDWADLPYEEVQHEHVNIVRYDMRYDDLYEKRDELFDQDELLDLHFKWKDAERDFYRAAEPIEDHIKVLRDRICRAEIDKRLGKVLAESETNSLKELFEAEEYLKITEVFKPYIEMQLSHAYMGRQMRHGTQFRWIFPRIIPLTEEELDILLTSMLKIGKQSTVEKLVGIYRRGNVLSGSIEKAAETVDLINSVRRAYYLGEYKEACRLVDESTLGTDIPTLSEFRWLSAVKGDISYAQAINLKAAALVLGSSDAMQKALGDYLWEQGNRYDAEAVYKNLMKSCRNGLFWLDIHSKFPDIDPIPTKRLTPFTDTDLTKKQRELLEEIVTICSNNNIRYVIGADLARRMYLTGNIGYTNSNRELFMDEVNAVKFMNAFKEDGKQCRRILTWKEGSKVKDIAMLYCDKESVYCDFRDLEKWRNIGTCITIRILGSGSGFTSLKCKLLGRDAEDIQEDDLFYYTNVNGKRPVKHAFKRELWEDTCTTEVSGISYTIPKAMTAKNVDHETDLANVPPINSIFIYRSSEMSWGEVSPLIDDATYSALDWDSYFDTRKKYRKIDDKVRSIWQTMLDIGGGA